MLNSRISDINKFPPEITRRIDAMNLVNLGDERKILPSHLIQREQGEKRKELLKVMEELGAVIPTVELKTQANELKPLAPEEKEALFATLQARFESNAYLHAGLSWVKVQTAFENKEAELASINQMEQLGHEPDVYDFDETGFKVGTCSKETPLSSRNCVYDEFAAEFTELKNSSRKFSGSATGSAKAIGVQLMDDLEYRRKLQIAGKGEFDQDGNCWLKTPDKIRKKGEALSGQGRDDDSILPKIYHTKVDEPSSKAGWRGSLKISW